MTIRTAAAVIALALVAGSAVAADLPALKSPLPLPPPPPLWTGLYAGLNAGGTFGGSQSVDTFVGPFFANPGWPHGVAAQTGPHLWALSAAASSSVSSDNTGFIGGGQVGYNLQFRTSFVTGVEVDIQGVAGANKSANAIGAAPVGASDPSNYISATWTRKTLDYFGTVRGRLGYLVTPTLLAYGTAGLAYGGVSVRSSVVAFNDFYLTGNHLPPVFGGANFADTRVGWTAGGGVEWLFLPNWSAKIEYLYYDLGHVAANFLFPQHDNVSGLNAGFNGLVRTRFDGHIVRAGVNYHFQWAAPAPILAKY